MRSGIQGCVVRRIVCLIYTRISLDVTAAHVGITGGCVPAGIGVRSGIQGRVVRRIVGLVYTRISIDVTAAHVGAGSIDSAAVHRNAASGRALLVKGAALLAARQQFHKDRRRLARLDLLGPAALEKGHAVAVAHAGKEAQRAVL
ncbi:MAG: hypothetical protein JXR83_00030 [Deltaproteobacteria bacterium]|nr:hypothetical protein [Deltaproteobacteria bacterium]